MVSCAMVRSSSVQRVVFVSWLSVSISLFMVEVGINVTISIRLVTIIIVVVTVICPKPMDIHCRRSMWCVNLNKINY